MWTNMCFSLYITHTQPDSATASLTQTHTCQGMHAHNGYSLSKFCSGTYAEGAGLLGYVWCKKDISSGINTCLAKLWEFLCLIVYDK